jgi:hypothetical protein
MKKLNEIIGHRAGARGCAINYTIAYAWYNSASHKGKTFTFSFSPECLEVMRYRKGDKCEIWIDEENKTAMLKLSQNGSHALSGDGAFRTMKIASRAACEYLATVFEIRESMTPLEKIEFGEDSSVKFKLAIPDTFKLLEQE